MISPFSIVRCLHLISDRKIIVAKHIERESVWSQPGHCGPLSSYARLHAGIFLLPEQNPDGSAPQTPRGFPAVQAQQK